MTGRTTENGFSLIEVVVALGVLSTAAVSLSMVGRGSLAGVKQVEARYLARTIADAELASVFLQVEPLEIGVEVGQGEQLGQTFNWTRTIQPSGRDGLLLVQIDVTAKDEETVLARANTLRRITQ